MKEVIINKNDAEQRIDKFLTKYIPNLPQPLMYKYIRKKRIKINGKRCEINTKLQEGDKLTLYINDEFFKLSEEKDEFLKAPLKLDIIYEDENIILIDKKPGLLVHKDGIYNLDTLILRIQHYLYKKGEYNPAIENSFVPSLVNRIDRNTGGIVIAAKNAESLRILNQKMKNRELDKFYLCLISGIMEAKEGILKAYLEKDDDKNKVYIYGKPTMNSKLIKTKYKVLKEGSNSSLVEVELLTGRTHQIRAHMAYIGHPLLGDGKYGKNIINKVSGFKYQALYSYKLKFNFITDAGMLNYLNKKEFIVPDVWFIHYYKI